ncbi:predicted protein [Methanosarcina acetivorans C2A]|uniref:DUF2795 domain-containing protein n=2 Tax=Methanosarcina acetivorans TaxID=2214 RepID=Q8TLD1_METAC|nr:predicted protein [Methanosarcina acetivorans C2A]
MSPGNLRRLTKVRGNIMETESKSRFITELPVETQKILNNITYPVNRSDIIGQARKSGAIPDIMRGFGMLPDRQYNSAEDVAEELHIIYMGVPAQA